MTTAIIPDVLVPYPYIVTLQMHFQHIYCFRIQNLLCNSGKAILFQFFHVIFLSLGWSRMILTINLLVNHLFPVSRWLIIYWIHCLSCWFFSYFWYYFTSSLNNSMNQSGSPRKQLKFSEIKYLVLTRFLLQARSRMRWSICWNVLFYLI